MKKRNLISKLNEKGYLLGKDTVEYLSTLSDDIINKVVDMLPNIDGIKYLQIPELQRIVFRINILSNLIYIKRPIYSSRTKIDTLIKLANERFDRISKILLDKIDSNLITTINKIKGVSNSFVIIGRVISKNLIENFIEVDDGTGILRAKLSGNESFPDEGEIIAIQCEKNNGNIMVKKIIYPDVHFTFTNVFGKSDIKILVSPTDDIPKDIDFDVCFVPRKVAMNDDRVLFISERCGDDKRCIENLSIIEVNGVKIQFVLINDDIRKEMEKYGSVENFIKRVLKRRLILTSEKHLIGLENDIYLLDVIPDLIIFFSNQNTYLNYKSIMVVSLDISQENKECFLIDMKEGKVVKCSR